MAIHRHWRLQISESTSGGDRLVALYDMELRATPGGADQCLGGVASASHNTATAYRAFDSSAGTYWTNGGPGLSSWLAHDCGTEVAVAELRLVPRYSEQAPRDFTLECSDDNASWEVVGSWTGVGGWIGGVEQLFWPTPAAPALIGAQCGQPFALALGRALLQPYPMGAWSQAACCFPYPLRLEAASAFPWDLPSGGGWLPGANRQLFALRVERAHGQPFSPLLLREHGQPWRWWLSRRLRQPLHDSLWRGNHHFWALRHRRQVGRLQPFAATTGRVASRLLHPYPLHPLNPLAKGMRRHWNLSAPRTIVQTPPSVTLAGPRQQADGPWRQGRRPLPLTAVVLRQEGESCAWSAELHLAEEADFAAMGLEDCFLLHLGGESYSLQVEGKRLERSGRAGQPRLTRLLTAVSPLLRHARSQSPFPPGQWPAASSARGVVETLLGESVAWSLPDWRLPAGSMPAAPQSALALVQRIAEAAGGVVQSLPDGRVQIRPRFPVSVPDWSRTPPHHLLTDDEDIVALCELQQAGQRVDRVVVRTTGSAAGQRGVALTLNRQPGGPNQGQSRFLPGDTAHLLLTPAAASSRLQVAASTGQVLMAEPSRWQQTEDLLFIASDHARLTTPATRILQVEWLGTDLGWPELQEDGHTLVTPQAGTAVSRITYEATAAAYAVQIPSQTVAREGYSILVTATGGSQGLAVAMQRGEASHPLQEVVEPLLSDPNLLSCRARAELDRGESLQVLELTIVYRAGLQSGQLVEVQDGGYGRTFRALLVGVRHEIGMQGWFSHLTLWRQGDFLS
ncbi:MAG: discoidin domain-containing protein [Magnetococcus sp. MYC-9]